MDFGSWKLIEYIKKGKYSSYKRFNCWSICSLNLILKILNFKIAIFGITSAGKGKNILYKVIFIFNKKCLSSKFFKDFFQT